MTIRLFLALAMAVGLAATPPSFTREGKGPGILLIHGYGGNRDVWKDLAADLARDHTVVTVDLPGSSRSEGPALVEGAADFEAIATDLTALVRREELAPCLVVGHSMGGPLAALTVLKDPAAFRGLVLVDSFLGTIPAAYFAPVIQGLDTDPKGTLARFFAPMAKDDAQRDRLVADASRIPVPILQAYLRGMLRDNLRGRQGQLKVPVLQLAAGPEEADPAKREAARAIYGFKGIPDFRVVAFPKARHWIMWDEADAFLAALRSFEKGR